MIEKRIAARWWHTAGQSQTCWAVGNRRRGVAVFEGRCTVRGGAEGGWCLLAGGGKGGSPGETGEQAAAAAITCTKLRVEDSNTTTDAQETRHWVKLTVLRDG